MNNEINSKESYNVSSAVIKRLPRYFRYLRILIREGKSRISSNELSERMHVTASQIRQDLNCFGGFGQQGYGYNVNYLYAKICDLLGVASGFSAIIIGAGNLGKALVRSSMFEKRGIELVGMFDVNPNVIDTEIDGIHVYDMKDLSQFSKEHHPEIAVLVVPKDVAENVAETCVNAGIRGLWNFTGAELSSVQNKIVLENVHLGDSLMTLCYNINNPNEKDENT